MEDLPLRDTQGAHKSVVLTGQLVAAEVAARGRETMYTEESLQGVAQHACPRISVLLLERVSTH